MSHHAKMIAVQAGICVLVLAVVSIGVYYELSRALTGKE